MNGKETNSLRNVGKYEVIGTLGRGASGVVYRAKDPEIGREVAIKVLRKIPVGLMQDADKALERFRNEARSAGGLRHPNIIAIFDINRDNDIPYLVMDYVEGESLEGQIAREGRIQPSTVLRYLVQIAGAVDYAHSKGVIHCDIKPGNVLVDKTGRVFVLDFGVAMISRSIGSAEAKQAEGQVVGSPAYMSPEQLLNKTLDARADLFSLAVMAFECFTGKRPFEGETFPAVVAGVLHGKPLSLTNLVSELPLALEAEFEKALAKDKANRFGSAAEMVDAFSKALGLVADTSTLSATGISLPSVRRRRTTGWKVIGGQEEGHSPKKKSRHRIDSMQEHSEWAARPPRVEGLSDTYFFGKQKIPSPGAIFGSGQVGSVRKGKGFGKSAMVPVVVALSIIAMLLGAAGIFIGLSTDSSTVPDRKVSGDALANTGGVVSQQNSERLPDIRIPAGEMPKEGKTVVSMSDKELLGVLTNRSSSEDSIIQALHEARARWLPSLVEASIVPLKHDSYVVRVEAIKVLAEVGDKRAVPELMSLIDDHDPAVRGHAAKALGTLGDRRSLGYLQMRYVKENDPNVRTAIKKAIEKIQGYPLTEDAKK